MKSLKLDSGFKVRLNFLMNEQKIGTLELAETMNISSRVITGWRNSNNNMYPELNNINKLASIFNVEVSWLIKGSI